MNIFLADTSVMFFAAIIERKSVTNPRAVAPRRYSDPVKPMKVGKTLINKSAAEW
tara:strand:+ start:1163 stop:1327 length:165 start_codon:yes stop_codon:yes gene_type:complete